MAESPVTRRLYLDDPLLARFAATVVAHGTVAGRASVVLDRSAFYPESGGQLADAGTLDELAVVDVQQDARGAIHHLVPGELPPIGAAIAGRIDMTRRRRHMAEHSGQHILSAAVLALLGARTRSSRLGESVCTLDVDVADLTVARLAAAEVWVHRLVERDLPVRCWVPEPDELASLVLRRGPKVSRGIRVVALGDIDYTPCGGTHCTSTAQVGLVLVVGAER